MRFRVLIAAASAVLLTGCMYALPPAQESVADTGEQSAGEDGADKDSDADKKNVWNGPATEEVALDPSWEYAEMSSISDGKAVLWHAPKDRRDIVIAVMIEKAEAVENIEEICSVPGVDMIQFGPNDYCLSRGWNRKDHMEEAKAAERLCIECALRHGIRPRCEIGSPEEAEYYISLGVRDFSLSDQMNILKNFWNTQGKKMREIALSASGN